MSCFVGQTATSYLTRPLSSRFKSSSLRSTCRMAASSSADRKLKSISSNALFDCFILFNKDKRFPATDHFPSREAANHRVFLKSEICQPTFSPYEFVPTQVNAYSCETFNLFRVIEEEICCTFNACHNSHSHSHGVTQLMDGVTSSVNIEFENRVNVSLPASFRSNLDP